MWCRLKVQTRVHSPAWQVQRRTTRGAAGCTHWPLLAAAGPPPAALHTRSYQQRCRHHAQAAPRLLVACQGKGSPGYGPLDGARWHAACVPPACVEGVRVAALVTQACDVESLRSTPSCPHPPHAGRWPGTELPWVYAPLGASGTSRPPAMLPTRVHHHCVLRATWRLQCQRQVVAADWMHPHLHSPHCRAHGAAPLRVALQ